MQVQSVTHYADVSCNVVLVSFTLPPLLGQLIREGFAGVYGGAILMLGAAH